MTSSRNSWVRVAAIAAASTLLIAACGDDADEPTPGATSAASTEPVTLKINYWGNFGLKELKPIYEKLHPNVTLTLNEGDYAKQHEDLQKFLVADSGAPDIAAIDEGFIVQFRNQPDKFVNLLDKGAADRKDDFSAWKWEQSLSADGKVQIGLGTDVGGLAMCYRKDLFEKAGLPTDRAEVSALWPDWAAFTNVGKDYVAGIKDDKKKFVDAAANVFNPVLGQQPVGYFTKENELVMDGGPKVAWDTATSMVDAGISANLAAFTPEWNAAFKNGSFAVLACPAWMQAYIQGQAPNTKGKWDIADIPGEGGNWGGSHYTIPAQGKNIDAAYEFVNWVTQPEQGLAIFKNVGNLPAQPAIYQDPAFVAYQNPFFSDAPTGQIFAKTAQDLQPQYLGSKNGVVRTAVEAVLTKVQNGQTDAVKGWEEAKKEAEKAAK